MDKQVEGRNPADRIRYGERLMVRKDYSQEQAAKSAGFSRTTFIRGLEVIKAARMNDKYRPLSDKIAAGEAVSKVYDMLPDTTTKHKYKYRITTHQAEKIRGLMDDLHKVIDTPHFFFSRTEAAHKAAALRQYLLIIFAEDRRS